MTDTGTNRTYIFLLLTKSSGLITTLVTRFLYILYKKLNQSSLKVHHIYLVVVYFYFHLLGFSVFKESLLNFIMFH